VQPIVSLDISMFTCVYFLQGPDATDESCWLQHSQETLFMNMVKWKSNTLEKWQVCYVSGMTKC